MGVEHGPPPQACLCASGEILEQETAQLRAALASRDVIGQAKGMIMLLTGCDAPSAFAVLSRISQDTNRKVRDLAELIVERAPKGIPLPADVHTSWRRALTAVRSATAT